MADSVLQKDWICHFIFHPAAHHISLGCFSNTWPKECMRPCVTIMDCTTAVKLVRYRILAWHPVLSGLLIRYHISVRVIKECRLQQHHHIFIYYKITVNFPHDSKFDWKTASPHCQHYNNVKRLTADWNPSKQMWTFGRNNVRIVWIPESPDSCSTSAIFTFVQRCVQLGKSTPGWQTWVKLERDWQIRTSAINSS